MNVGIVSAPPSQVLCDKLAWVADGFRAVGHDVTRCHTMRDVRMADAKCDLMVFDHKGAGVCKNSLADFAELRKAKWLYWWRDSITFFQDTQLRSQPYIQSFLRLMRCMDAVLVKERGLLTDYRSLGINALWFDQACPADMPACSHPEKPEWDVLVPGVAAYQQRRADAKALADAGFKVLWVGLPSGDIPAGCDSMPWVHPTKGLPQLVSRSAVVLGVDFRSDLDGFTSDRTYLVAGMGACLVRRESLGMPQIPSWSYADHGSLVDTVRMLVSSAELRRQTGDEARQCVMANHTYTHRAREIIALSKAESRQCVSG